MSTWRWLYNEFGLASVRGTGLDCWLILIARSSRMFSFGAASVFFALFFSALGFSDVRIGLFQTLTLVGDVVLTLGLTLVADRVGRRRTIFLGSVMMILSGLCFVLTENFWVLLFSAIIGVVSASGGDFGPFRAIEESILSQLTSPDTRNDVLAWYVTTASLGSAAGTEVAGRIVAALTSHGWSDVEAYHAIFGLYVVTGLVNVACVLALSSRTEIEQAKDEVEEVLLKDRTGGQSDEGESNAEAATTTQSPATRGLASLAASTRAVMFKLWPLLVVDSLADGMVNYSLTTYYIDRKFDVDASVLGDVTSVSYILASISTIFAGPLANRLGLLNTMVFTHVPSSAAVCLFPAPYGLGATIALLLVRIGLNNMDQAPRAAFIAAAVPAHERTAVNGITSMLRTLAATIGPTITGGLAQGDRFWIAFVAAGSLRLAYDFGLWALFRNLIIDEKRTRNAG